MAANLYRKEIRATEDVDLSIKVRRVELAALVDKFLTDGWQVEQSWKNFEQLRLRHPHLAQVDCLLAGTEFEESAIKRADTVDVAGHELRVLRPEDLIVMKLIAGRARDYDAVGAIINDLGEQLDTGYITGWLEQFEIGSRWAQALEEAKHYSRE